MSQQQPQPQPQQQQQQQAAKMSAAPLPEPAAGMLEGRQRKLESMIRDPRSPVNVESLLVRGWRRRGRRRGGGGTKAAPRQAGRKEGKSSGIPQEAERGWGRLLPGPEGVGGSALCFSTELKAGGDG